MSKSDTFNETVELIRKGQDVSEEELVDAWSYAADGVNEMFRMAKNLVAGYRAQQEAIRRKNALLEAKIKELETMKRTNYILNRKLNGLPSLPPEKNPAQWVGPSAELLLGG